MTSGGTLLILKRFVIVVTLILLCAGCGRLSLKQQLIKDMASFDSTCIAALIFLDVGKQHETKLAMERFNSGWNGFRDKYYKLELKYGQNITDSFWQEDFDRIDTLVGSAEILVEEKKLLLAKEKLESIKLIMRDMRRRHGLNYYLDALTDFQKATLDMRQPIAGKKKLKERDVVDLRGFFQIAQQSLADLAKKKIDHRFFPMSQKQLKAIAKRLENEQKLMGGVAAAITTRQIPLIAASIDALQPDLALTYRAFGDTQPIFDQILKERKEKEGSTTSTTLKKAKINKKLPVKAKRTRH